MDDEQLLRSYATHRSEEAFRELVRRHIAVVHGVAHWRDETSGKVC